MDLSKLEITQCEPSDWLEVWSILKPVFRRGDSYAIARDISESEAQSYWLALPRQTWIARNASQQLVGSYYLKPNQPGPGSHVCNCGYIVGEHFRGQGIAKSLCRHSLQQARKLGYLAMQFNFVVSTNHVAIHTWQQLGFDIVGTLPKAFEHPQQGLVDAHVMYQWLDSDSLEPESIAV